MTVLSVRVWWRVRVRVRMRARVREDAGEGASVVVME